MVDLKETCLVNNGCPRAKSGTPELSQERLQNPASVAGKSTAATCHPSSVSPGRHAQPSRPCVCRGGLRPIPAPSLTSPCFLPACLPTSGTTEKRQPAPWEYCLSKVEAKYLSTGGSISENTTHRNRQTRGTWRIQVECRIVYTKSLQGTPLHRIKSSQCLQRTLPSGYSSRTHNSSLWLLALILYLVLLTLF